VLVEQGLLADLADALLEAFSVSIRLRRPFLRIKWAQSLDGRLACRGGASRWITDSEARVQAHELRALHDAILIGAGTLRADDPELTVRDVPVNPELGLRKPLRIILAGREPLPLDARVFSAPLVDRTIVLAARTSPVLAECRVAGIRVIDVASTSEGLPDLLEGFRGLYSSGVGSILVEGGARLITALIARNLWDAVTVFTAPLILGEGIEAIGDLGIVTPDSGIRLENAQFQVHGGFIRLDARNSKGRDEVADLNTQGISLVKEHSAPSPAVLGGSCLQD
jgi:riboflavin-specific deaminase-like protein